MSPHFESIHHKYGFAYRKHYACNTALLSLTEKWRRVLDNHKVIEPVSMDLPKSFDTLSHDLIVLKLWQYGAAQTATALIKDYLSILVKELNMETVTLIGKIFLQVFHEDPYWVHGYLTFLCLAYVVNQSKISAYANDTHIIHRDKYPTKVEEIINANVDRMRWYAENRMKSNHFKYQAIVMGKTRTKLWILLRKYGYFQQRETRTTWGNHWWKQLNK